MRQIQFGGPEGCRHHLACMIVLVRASLMPSLKDFFFPTLAEGTPPRDSKQKGVRVQLCCLVHYLTLQCDPQVLMLGPQSKDFREESFQTI